MMKINLFVGGSAITFKVVTMLLQNMFNFFWVVEDGDGWLENQ